MQFALSGVRFDAFVDPDGLYYGGIIATREDGMSSCFEITDFAYSVSPVNAIRAARGFLAEIDAAERRGRERKIRLYELETQNAS